MGAGEAMTAAAGGERAGVKPLLTVLAWSVGAVSLAAFAAAWVLAARNRDLSDISAGFSPDRFMVAYPVVGALLASRRRSNPIGWLVLGVGIVTATRALAGEYALHELAGPSHPPSGVWAAPSARRLHPALSQTVLHRQPPTLATCTYRSQSASRDVRMSA